MSEKYELTDDSIKVFRRKLFRIRSLRAFAGVRKGELGGYVENENNLAHEGNAWVSGNAKVFGDAEVFGNAEVFGDAWVFENAKVSGRATFEGEMRIISSIPHLFFKKDADYEEYLKAIQKWVSKE